MKATETVLLFIIGILMISLVWVTTHSRRCDPMHPDLIGLSVEKTSTTKKPFRGNGTNINQDVQSTTTEQVEDSIGYIRNSVYQYALNPFLVLQKSVDGPPPTCTPSGGECSILCSNYPAENFHDMVEFINKNFQHCDQGRLDITGTNFQNRVIQSGWLKDMKMQITQLGLLNNLKCNAAHMGQAAFSGAPFDSLDYLTVVEGDLKYLEKKVFEGSGLHIVEIRHNEQRAIKFEAGVFEHTRTTLQMLQLQRCIEGPETLRNITGSKAMMLSAILQLDLKWNVISEITSDVFTKVGMVSSIFLDSCLIESIDVHAFDYLRNLQQLTLSGNFLTTLPERIFSHTTSLNKINMEENPWICDCNLEWLKEMYVATPHKFIKHLYCGDIEFSDAQFICWSTVTESPATTSSEVTSTNEGTTEKSRTSLITTSEPTSLTTITSEPITTVTMSSSTDFTTTSLEPTTFPVTKKPNVVRIKCIHTRSVDYFDTADAIDLSLAKNNSALSFVVKDDGNTASCDIKLIGDFEDSVMYFLLRDLTNDQFKCYNNVTPTNPFKLERLDYNKSYLGCVLPSKDANVNPYNCIAITTPVPYKDRPWLTNCFKTTAIIILVVASIILIVLTAVIMYCCLRQRTQHYVDSPHFVMPKTSLYHEYTAPSYRSISDGYLTPKTVRSAKYYEAMPISPSRFRRKSYQVSYQAPGYLGRYSFMRRRNSGYNSEHLYEVPPPLPPNHPMGETCIPHSDMSQFM